MRVGAGFLLGLVSAGLGGTTAFGQSFTGLGDLAGGATSSRATGVGGTAADPIISGYGSSTASGGGPLDFEAARWQGGGNFAPLGDLTGGIFNSEAFAISGDGLTIVGTGSSAVREAFRWTQAGGMVGLGFLSDGTSSGATGVSTNGAVIVGSSTTTGGSVGFRWQNNVMTALPDLATGDLMSGALGVSGDGTVAVGFATTASGVEAARWIGTNLTSLGDFAGGLVNSTAYAASSDASVIVGFGQPTNTQVDAFRWTQDTGLVGLGDLAGGAEASEARAVSADGCIIVGQANSSAGEEAFIWDPLNGLRGLKSVLTGLGVNTSTWKLQTATGISPDGTVICGDGINPSGQREAWMAKVPAPAFSLAGAFSRKTHGGAGVFDLPLSLTGTNVEPRKDGATRLLLDFTCLIFAQDGTFSANEVALSTGTVQSVSASVNRLTINLAGVTNGACLRVTVSGIVNQSGAPLTGDRDVTVTSTLGNADASSAANLADLKAIKSRVGQAVNSGNYKYDVNADGALNAQDLQSLINNLVGNSSCPTAG